MSSVPRELVVALGSGGMRGVAHLGVLEVLAEAGIRIRGIAGTSSGALLGALWLLRPKESVALVRAFLASGRVRKLPDLHRLGQGSWPERLLMAWHLGRVFLRKRLLAETDLLASVRFFLPEMPLEAMPLPFVVVATDSLTGEEVWLQKGSLVRAVAASSAMPGLVAPLELDGRFLQDGGAVAEIPVRAARALGSPVLAVEVSEALPQGFPGQDGLARAMLRAAAMGWRALRKYQLKEADFALAPKVNHLHWADFHAVDEAVEAGRAAARQFLAHARTCF